MLLEQLLKGSRGALLQSMDSLDQTEDVGSHDEKVAKATGAGIPIRVRRAARNENSGTCTSFDFVFAGLHAKRSFEHVPCFVVAVVDVARSYQPRWPGWTTSILPFSDDERIV